MYSNRVSGSGFHLAQANVAYVIAPHDDPRLADYMARLDEINQLADRSAGFVWRYLTDSRDAGQREFADPRVLFNMSVWKSVDALHAYAYRTAHSEVYAERKHWFVDVKAVVGGHALALWWVTAGERPTVADGSAGSPTSSRTGHRRARSRSSSGSTRRRATGSDSPP